MAKGKIAFASPIRHITRHLFESADSGRGRTDLAVRIISAFALATTDSSSRRAYRPFVSRL